MALPKTRYKKLLSEKQFLRVAERARKVTGVHIVSIDYSRDEVRVICDSVSTPGKKWVQRIQLVDLLDHKRLEEAKRGPSKGTRDLASHARKAMIQNFKDPIAGKKLEKAILDSPIRVACDCPAFHWWGYKYMAWRKGYGIVPEHHVPHVRNPQQQGYVCKHLHCVLLIWPLLAKTVARRIKAKDDDFKDISN